MEWETVDPSTVPGWDDLVTTHPGCSFFHGDAWSRVLRDAYGAQPRYWVRRGEYRLRDLLPVMEIKSALAGCRAVSLPFTDECGPLLDEDTHPRDLLPQIQHEGIRRGWRFWEGRGDWRVAPPSVSYWGHQLQIEREPGLNLVAFDPALRRAIRKAEKAGLTVAVETNSEAMRTFFALHCQTRRKHGVPPQPVEFFERIQQHVIALGQGMVVTASLGDRPVAAAVFFILGKRAVYKFGASASEFLSLRGNNLVMWEAIRELSRRGAESLDFGRTSKDNEGLRRYKAGFGAAEREIAVCRYDFRARSFVPGRDRAHGWHNRVFRLLPLPLLRLAGRLLYPHLT